MPGSDLKINYNIRPAKSVERKMMCEMLRELQIAVGQDDYRYIGLGAKYFADFILFHSEFGFEEMISIEAQEECQDRYEYNKPLKCIKMRYGYTKDQLPQINMDGDKPNFIWLDYDQTFCEYMVDDIITLIGKVSIGSLFFISCNSSCKGYKLNEKLEDFTFKVGKYAPINLNKNDIKQDNIATTIKDIINNSISDTLKRINILKDDKIKYKQLLFVTYKDGAPMITIGGILIDENLEKILNKFKLEDRHPFIITDSNSSPYNIEIPNLTLKEAQAILQFLPVSEENHDGISVPGITKEQVIQFGKIYRYYPYFIEARAFN